MNTWKPIDTAPKDGTAILAILPDNDVPYAVIWSEWRKTWSVEWDDWDLPENQWPTHWMPCPPPPAGNLTETHAMRTITAIPLSEWDKLVTETYGRPYRFQQQDGCVGRGTHRFKVPDEADDEDMNDSVPEVVNHETRGVKFDVWKSRDPKQPLGADEDAHVRKEDWAIKLWWHRNFYPDFHTVANDLHARGLLDAGEHTIIIDW